VDNKTDLHEQWLVAGAKAEQFAQLARAQRIIAEYGITEHERQHADQLADEWRARANQMRAKSADLLHAKHAAKLRAKQEAENG
jgi:ubiquinone biosynthesis protein UbiJ